MRTRHALSLLALVALVGARPATAQSFDFDKCGDLPQQPMNACVSAEARATDSVLGSLVRTLRPKVDAPAMWTQLQSTQRSWRRYREAECRWQSSWYDGGSIQPTIYAGCLVSEAWQRIDALRPLLCDGGNDGCPAAVPFQRPRRHQVLPSRQ